MYDKYFSIFKHRNLMYKNVYTTRLLAMQVSNEYFVVYAWLMMVVRDRNM
jgi:hypothetical protein